MTGETPNMSGQITAENPLGINAEGTSANFRAYFDGYKGDASRSVADIERDFLLLHADIIKMLGGGRPTLNELQVARIWERTLQLRKYLGAQTVKKIRGILKEHHDVRVGTLPRRVKEFRFTPLDNGL